MLHLFEQVLLRHLECGLVLNQLLVNARHVLVHLVDVVLHVVDSDVHAVVLRVIILDVNHPSALVSKSEFVVGVPQLPSSDFFNVLILFVLPFLDDHLVHVLNHADSVLFHLLPYVQLL